MFAGMEYDSTTGLYYDHARYYDAAIGRFGSQDPMGFAAGDTNLYRYVRNGPTIATDPSGALPPPKSLPNPDTAYLNTYEGGILFSNGLFYSTLDGEIWNTWVWDKTGQRGTWIRTWGQPNGWPVQWLRQPIPPNSPYKRFYPPGYRIPILPPPLPNSPTGKYLKRLQDGPEPGGTVIA
jgi:RHS repeat-associated protein